VNIWKDDGDKLKNLFKLSQEENAVTTADWSPDEKRVVIGSRPDNLYVHDVDLNQQIKKIKLEYIPLAVSWDPRNGYVALLTLENCVTFYDALTFDQKKKVSFNAGSSKFSDLRTKRNERIITWSPDGEFCMCPNLEDKNELPMLLGIDRPKGFVVSSVFAGPTASISCISFLDALFRKGSDLYCIFAMGDCDGNISIWQTKGREKPIHYIKGGAEDMVIENIYWD
jgi:WD40 repeat protein